MLVTIGGWSVSAHGQSVQQDLQQLSGVLGDENAKPEDREEAARRLVSRNSIDGRQILNSVLVSVGNRDGQLAVARALASSSANDPQFVVPLFALLGPDRALTDAAADALATYKGNAQVLSGLIEQAQARQQPAALRIACIRALGTMNEKRAAQALIALLTNDQEGGEIRTAAADALVQLTGLRENGQEVPRWQQWWKAHADETDDQWRQNLLNVRSARLSELQGKYSRLVDEIRTVLTDQYQLVPDVEKPDMVMRFLKADEPVIRALGAKLVFDDNISNRTIPPAIRQQLRKMVGDSSAEVRLEVATTLRALNDADALDPLLAQLAQETDPAVKAALAGAIAPIRDLRALPELRKLLNDPSFAAAQAGAEAITELAPLILQKDPAAAGQIATELNQSLDQRGSAPGNGAWKEAVVEAMANLHQPSLDRTFYHLLTSSQPPSVRRWAIHGLSELKDNNSLDLIINSLDDSDASVRLEAVNALSNVGTFENGELLYRRMNQTEEPDQGVRDAAWQVLIKLLAGAPTQQLTSWADRFSDDPARRAEVLKILADKQTQAHAEDDLAYTQQNIGECLMKTNQPAQASDYFRQALDYWSKKNEERFTAGLTQQLITALLRAHEYTDAVQFGSTLIQNDRSQQMTVGPAIRAEAERLRDSGDLQSVLVLIDEAKKMSPALDPRYAHDLDDIAADVRKRIASQGSSGT
ncbi:MAG TPA: HEAT repeat domain-containing protein [Tepidisphaeraceae bacterium]